MREGRSEIQLPDDTMMCVYSVQREKKESPFYLKDIL